MQISIGITVKVIEVQCATVSEMLSGKWTKSVVNKRKHDDDVEDVEDEGPSDDRDPGHPSAAPAKKVKLPKLKKVGRPNRARQANVSNLWEALKAGINFERSPHQAELFEKFKAGTCLTDLTVPLP